MTVSRPAIPSVARVNLGFVHLSSPFGKWNSDTHMLDEGRRLSEQIGEFEVCRKTPDSLLIGDFNMDPYSPATINGKGLNAAMCRAIASRGTRKFGSPPFDRDYRYFYNPMWRLLGDCSASSQPGSFYRSGDSTGAVFWHCLDQVLVRPGLIACLVQDTPRLVIHSGKSDLLTSRRVVDKKISDHLPVLVSLDL